MVSGQLAGLTAASDLSSYQYCNVKMASATTVDMCGANERGIGVLLNKPESGEAADVALYGIVMMVVDGNAGAITAGTSYLHSDAAGKGVATTTDTHVLCGLALAGSSAAGDIIPVLLITSPLAG